MKEIEAKQELATRLEEKNEILKDANHKLEQLFSELEQTRLQHMEDEVELRKRSELDTLKNEYVAMVSHELRSPLTSVRGAVGILSAGLADSRTEKGAKLFHIALRNLDRMIRLVNDVLNLERLASGPGSLHMQRCLLGELVQQAVETMTPIAQGLNVRLIDNASTLKCDPMISFRGDADKTLQVLINLLSNGIKFSPAGAHVKVDVALNADTFTIKISDEGRGIPQDQLEKVFEPFQQVERNDARRLGGTGLGLAICRTIVEQHGGAIWAERNAEKGHILLRDPTLFSEQPSKRRTCKHTAAFA